MRNAFICLLLATVTMMQAQTPQQDLNVLLAYYGTSGLTDEGAPPPDIVPRWFSNEYHHLVSEYIVMSAEFTQGTDTIDGHGFKWFFNQQPTPWWDGETWFTGAPVWECDMLFNLTLVVDYKGQTWTRTTACLIWWDGDLYPDCTDGPLIEQVIIDGAAMSFGEFEPYHFLDWPKWLDTDGDWHIDTRDLLALLTQY